MSNLGVCQKKRPPYVPDFERYNDSPLLPSTLELSVALIVTDTKSHRQLVAFILSKQNDISSDLKVFLAFFLSISAL